MNGKIKQFAVSALEWRMAVVMFILFSISSLCSCILAAMAGSIWHLLDNQSKFTVIVAILGNWTSTIIAYISKSAQRIKQGDDLINPPDDATLTPKPTDSKS